MQYVGMMTQIRRNNLRSVLLLLSFPLIILATVWVFLAIIQSMGAPPADAYGNVAAEVDYDAVNRSFVAIAPWVVGIVGVWFLIAYFANSSMVRAAMDMPQINIVNDPQLNAFASGIDKKSYTVTVTTGLLRVLNDDELAGVLGHELTHIRNRDTRVLITSIVFVGIVSTVMSVVMHMMYNAMFYGSHSRSRDEKGSGVSIIIVMLVGVVCCAVAYFFTLITRFAISRKREYMADAGGAELCGNPLALASALRKISGAPGLQGVQRQDVAQLFIIHPQALTSGMMGFFDSLFSTHPDTRKRIAILEQF